VYTYKKLAGYRDQCKGLSNYMTIQTIPQNQVFPAKFLEVQTSKKFPEVYGIRSFFTVFTSFWNVPYLEPD
jgi:hypothetical protein